jgi:cytoskeletal protein CcmA (bactofilin family)
MSYWMRPLGVGAAVAAILVLGATPALAQDLVPGDTPQIMLVGDLHVPDGVTVSDAVVMSGDLTIDGEVTGNALAFNGDIVVNGSVGGTASAFNGRVTLGEGAVVEGDVISRQRPVIDPGAIVGGQILRPELDTDLARAVGWVTRYTLWFATSLSALALGMLLVWFVPRGMESAASTARSRTGASIGWGALLFFVLPIAGVLAMVLVVGIPLGLGILLAFVPLAWVGWTGGAHALGRLMVKAPKSRFIPFVAGAVWVIAVIWGLGALAVAAFTASRAPATAPPPAPPMPVDATS